MEKNLYNLTKPQMAIWNTEQFNTGTAIGNICGSLTIEEPVDFDKLTKSINLFVEKNDSFRIKLTLQDSNIMQYFSDFSNFEIETISVSNVQDVKELENELVSKPFTLIESLLFKFILFKLPNNHGGFIINAHHLISDAWTAGLVVNEIMNFYNNIDIDATFPSYQEFISSEKEYFKSDKFVRDKEFWNNQFSNVPEPINIPGPIISNNAFEKHSSKRELFIIDKSLVDNISTFCSDKKISIFNFFMAIYSIYFGRINCLEQFVIGTPILNRGNFKEKSTTGMFISTVPFKIDLSNSSFSSLANTISSDFMKIFRHQKYPYQNLLSDLRKIDPTLPNLYNIMISYQNVRSNKQSFEIPYTSRWLSNNCLFNDINIHLYDMDDTGSLNVAYDYLLYKYSLNDIQDIHLRIIHTINQVLNDSNILISDIEIITPSESNKILKNFNNTYNNFNRPDTIIELFEEQVKTSPNHTALCFNNNTLTYKELNEKANSLANHLMSEGVTTNDSIGIVISHSIELIISILAILKCGCHYIAIDPLYPVSRIDYILKDSNCKHILTNLNKYSFDNHPYTFVDYNNLESSVELNKKITYNTDQLVYILYTSGSTGNPKGVKIANSSLSNYILWAYDTYCKDMKSNFALYTSISFDLTVTSIFTPLISGNTIYIYNDDNPEKILFDIFNNKDIDVVKLTPSHLKLVLNLYIDDFKATRLIVGGEDFKTNIAQQITNLFNNNVKIYNEYGPTEATIGCMIYLYSSGDNKFSSVPIGYPINNGKIYVLDKHHNLLPKYSIGEMYIGGDVLSKGYLNLEDKTKESFTFSNKLNQLLYKTSDLACFYDDYKNIYYYGRIGNQVKINGFRIELEEIQSKINEFTNSPSIVLPITNQSNNTDLCAYLVNFSEKSFHELRNYLNQFLPYYMIPKYYIVIDNIPLNINGKVDIKKLPVPSSKLNDIIELPSTEIETIIYNTVKSIIKIDNLSVTENIFYYGIDSLTLIHIKTILDTKNISINLQDFYEFCTIRSIAEHYLSKKQAELNRSCTTCSDIKEIKKEITPEPNNKNSVFVLGSNGFVGIHVIYDILKNTSFNIISVVRDKDGISGINRFFNAFKYYFGEKELHSYINRINIYSGNIQNENFGLNIEELNLIGNSTKYVINSAANVRHYGSYDLFKVTNVDVNERAIIFCLKHNIPLHFISTVSVSGYGLVNNPKSDFTESTLDIGQSYEDNVYVRSKFEAEQLIIDYIPKGLVASIYRIGNITGRYSDGINQINKKENAFINQLKSIIELKYIPENYEHLDILPVDICSNIIVKLLNNSMYNINIFHILNPVKIETLIDLLKSININIQTCDIDFFKNLITNYSNSFVLTDFINNPNYFNTNITDNYTKHILKSLGYSLPELNNKYIKNLIENIYL